jgi:hypothetical protein
MKYLPIIAGSRIELDAFLNANPWIDRECVVRIGESADLLGRAGLVLALPGWEFSPSIRRPRELLTTIATRGMQLVVLEQAAYQLTPGAGGPSLESKIAAQHQHTQQRFEGELP